MFAGCCELCGAPAHAAVVPLCTACWSALPYLGPACLRCAMPLPRTGVCGRCTRAPPRFDSAVAALRYQFPVDRLIQQFKYAGRVDLTNVLGMTLAYAVGDPHPRPDWVVPVPLHPARQRQRGFNQAAQLGRVVARKLGIRLALDVAHRIRNTQPQAGLDARARRRNLRAAFAVTMAMPCRHIALIDDVFTTGDTVTELAATLKHAGVQRVDVWVCARAL